MVNESIANAERGGVEDLPLQDAALKATNMVGEYFINPFCSSLSIYITPRPN
jgi:hypothetical protein